MSPALANFLFEAANFLLLAAALRWVLFKPVRNALDAEREAHEKQKAEQERLRDEAESLAQQTRAERQALERESGERRRELLASAQKEAAALLEEARKAQRAEREALQQELAALRHAELMAAADGLGRLAADSVRQLLGALAGPALDSALVRAACSELEGLSAQGRKTARVESARRLEPEARQLLEATLGGPFEENVVAELGAGVRVTTSTGQVDATALSMARRAAEALRQIQPELPRAEASPSHA